jgi:ADP-heptose:LPS heptosyltransferase
MYKSGKNFKIFGIRGSLIGDSIFALPILTFLEKQFKDSYKYWQIAKKCSQAAPLYYNHPLIDKIIISDCDEGIGPKDKLIIQDCDMVFNVMPSHPWEQDWPNYRNCYEETWVMSGLDIRDYYKMTEDERRPKLYQWFDINPIRKSIAIWPCAGYGMEGKRHPSRDWYNKLVKQLSKKYDVYQMGHPNDFSIDGLSIANDKREMSFFDQIKFSLGCSLVITTDSGSGIVLGAYSANQISLLTNHFPGHNTNYTAFAPNNINNTNFIGIDNPNNIHIEEIVDSVNNKIII